MGKTLTKEELRNLKGQDIETTEVSVPEWGQDAVVRLRVMGGFDSESFESLVQKKRKPGSKGEDAVMNIEGLRWAILRRTMVDENNEPLFENDEEAKEVLGELNYRTITKLTLEAMKINGLSEDAVAEAEKNSSATPPEDTGTDSQGNGGGASRKRRQKSTAGNSTNG